MLHADADRLDLTAPARGPDVIRLSLSDTAFVEILNQLVKGNGGIQFSAWVVLAKTLSESLDRKWPFFPSGRQLSALIGLQTDLQINSQEEQAYLQACWKLVSTSKSIEELSDGLRFATANGRFASLRFDRTNLENVVRSTRQNWIDFVGKQTKELAERDSAERTQSAIYARMSSGLGSGPHDPPNLATRLDAVIQLQARLLSLAVNEKEPYDPSSEKKKGDAFDMRLLFCLPVPSIVATADKVFIKRLRASGASESSRVIHTTEFNERARAGTLSQLVLGVRGEKEQFDEWQRGAYLNWLLRGTPHGDEWTDWFAAEPIA